MTGQPTVILASTSPYRRELFSRLRVPFTCQSPSIDEQAIAQDSPFSPRDLASELARKKCLAVASRYPNAVVIGSDQVASCNGVVFHKPGTPDAAREQLASLTGRAHELSTAVAVAGPGGSPLHEHVHICRLAMRPLSTEEIDRYVEADRPWDCAGAYKIESLGISLFERIETNDPTAIIGLPLMFTSRALRTLGIPVP